MHNTLTFPPAGLSDVEPNPVFNVVIAYEDFEMGKHAKRTYDYLVEHLSDECRFANQMWKFDVLAVTKLREMAAKDAAAADIIIVSAHGSSDLPEEVKSWLELWLLEPHEVIAIVGLFDADQFMRNPAREYLERTAKRGRVEFFSQPGNWPGRKAEDAMDLEGNGGTSSLLAGIMQQRNDTSHWGINE